MILFPVCERVYFYIYSQWVLCDCVSMCCRTNKMHCILNCTRILITDRKKKSFQIKIEYGLLPFEGIIQVANNFYARSMEFKVLILDFSFDSITSNKIFIQRSKSQSNCAICSNSYLTYQRKLYTFLLLLRLCSPLRCSSL